MDGRGGFKLQLLLLLLPYCSHAALARDPIKPIRALNLKPRLVDSHSTHARPHFWRRRWRRVAQVAIAPIHPACQCHVSLTSVLRCCCSHARTTNLSIDPPLQDQQQTRTHASAQWSA
ncbi:uncharacterized protein K452DRAFT_111140 [Aplosporella prunicola CBS 121167]|uniref:Secreted protein n=1 Tax=Aplosporella prunicola CBS 121167 TaxID=1176127 RepID=A0A6A6B063_9PEZI|nr:uncharacterized protein K452DRAFT_111140 [Aplosporella prunicola CBS 121167]KAF2137266.1 hypothetical protein K452DRAFT_111140 [Aplosporella prunicola CBS 121167]